MRQIMGSIEGEYRRYKALGEGAIEQLADGELEKWEKGWTVLFRSLAELDDEGLHAVVKIRGVPLSVHGALHRSLAHTSYHVGQIVFLGKAFRGGEWKYLSIPPAGSAAYNANPFAEKPPGPSR